MNVRIMKCTTFKWIHTLIDDIYDFVNIGTAQPKLIYTIFLLLAIDNFLPSLKTLERNDVFKVNI